jgi:hypothetical protein
MRWRAQFQFAAVPVWLRVLFAAVPNAYLFSHRQARQQRPAVAKIRHLAHFFEKLRMRVVVLPAPGIPQFDEILLPTLDQREPSAGGTVVRAFLPFDMKRAKSAVESALSDDRRAALIRATKNECVCGRLFVDF